MLVIQPAHLKHEVWSWGFTTCYLMREKLYINARYADEFYKKIYSTYPGLSQRGISYNYLLIKPCASDTLFIFQ